MAFFLGIDAGATKTQCVLGTEIDVLARAQGGSIKITRVGESTAVSNLEKTLAVIVEQSGVALNAMTGTCIGLSGIAIASVAGWVRNALSSRVSGQIMLCGDEEIALDAAFHGGRGILVIAGTGSHVVGRTRDGQLVRTGGWGPMLSDQGAGSRIGLLALRAIFHAMDASQETSLLPALHAAWNTQTIEELIDLGNRVPPADLSQLAPMVAACAAKGDAVARHVLQKSGEEIAELVLLALRKGISLEASASSRTQSTDSSPWTIAFTGSIVEKISLLRESMIETIHRSDPAVQFLSEPVDPAMGALWKARMHRSSKAKAIL